jgi:hypothetical protein
MAEFHVFLKDGFACSATAFCESADAPFSALAVVRARSSPSSPAARAGTAYGSVTVLLAPSRVVADGPETDGMSDATGGTES